MPAGGPRLFRHLGETAVANLFFLRAGTRDAGLARKAIGVALTLIRHCASAAHTCTLRAIGVVGTVSLGVELADVERADHSPRTGAEAGNPACSRKLRGSGGTRNEGRCRSVLTKHPCARSATRWIVARAGDSEESHAHRSAKHPHHVHHQSSTGFHLYMVPSL